MKPNLLPEKFVIFFSWQSDLPKSTNRSFIEKAIHAAIAKLKQELPDEVHTTFFVDHATRDQPGTADITNSITSKIAGAHAVVADITTVIPSVNGTRAFPNPNVTFEAGLAVGMLGWGRVICIANTDFGKVPEDVPSDLHGKFIFKYGLKEGGDKEKAKGELESALYDALKGVIEAHCRGELPERLQPHDQLKRRKDIAHLESLMSLVHRPTFHSFLDHGDTGYLYYPSVSQLERFIDKTSSPHFHLYNQAISSSIHDLRLALGAALNVTGEHFQATSNPTLWKIGYRHKHPGDSAQASMRFRKAVTKADGAYREMLRQIHTDYPELDLDDTDHKALTLNKKEKAYVEADSSFDGSDEDGDQE
ncbi:nucleotide-binding protein [Pyxidicoccus caerfyrddinensis]|uniref:nucleotide-binding protein n=1 Tax=Pyxidicoccus caerfyrddinensis TaxID=2709663 RepID=UPI0013DB4D82|nr:nucleotide-binding protein [Pyxidicoccus caerfyrddinensis]